MTFRKTKDLINKTAQILAGEKEEGRGRLTSLPSEYFFVDENIAHLPQRGTAYFVGDTHGDLTSTEAILRQINFENRAKREIIYLVFLGDYADRGKRQLENVLKVLDLKIRFPQNVVLLRGNHETKEVGRMYGFFTTLQEKFGENRGSKLFDAFHEQLFDLLPYVLITENKVIAVHGGVSTKIPKKLEELNKREFLDEIIWNDPSGEIEESAFNDRRGIGNIFGEKVFRRFMDAVGANVLICSHNPVLRGLELKFEDRLATIFSTCRKSPDTGYGDLIQKAFYAKVGLEKPILKWKEENFEEIRYT